MVPHGCRFLSSSGSGFPRNGETHPRECGIPENLGRLSSRQKDRSVFCVYIVPLHRDGDVAKGMTDLAIICKQAVPFFCRCIRSARKRYSKSKKKVTPSSSNLFTTPRNTFMLDGNPSTMVSELSLNGLTPLPTANIHTYIHNLHNTHSIH